MDNTKPVNLFIDRGRNSEISIPSPKPLFPSSTETNAFSGYIIVDNPIISKKSDGPKTLLSDAKIRNRIKVEISDLQKYHKSTKVLNESKRQILMTNVDELNLTYVLDWGSHLQKNHSEYLKYILKLSTSPELNESKTLVNQLIQSLDDINIIDATKNSLFKSKEKKINSILEKLEIIQEKAGELTNKTDSIIHIHDEAKLMSKYLTMIQEELEPYIVTCSFFSTYEKDGFPKELYLSRLSSLLSTQAAVINDEKTLKFLLESFINLIDIINAVIRNELLSWTSNLISVLSGNISDLSNIENTKTTIINKLTKIL